MHGVDRLAGPGVSPSTSPTARPSPRSSRRSARVDVLVNNAGGVARPDRAAGRGGHRRGLAGGRRRQPDQHLRLHPGRRRRDEGARGWGRVVNISSGAGRSVSLTGIQAYASAKAGQIGFTRQTAHELGPLRHHRQLRRPRLRALQPQHRARSGRATGPRGQAALLDGIAVRRLGTPEDIATRRPLLHRRGLVLGDGAGHRHRRRPRDLLAPQRAKTSCSSSREEPMWCRMAFSAASESRASSAVSRSAWDSMLDGWVGRLDQ